MNALYRSLSDRLDQILLNCYFHFYSPVPHVSDCPTDRQTNRQSHADYDMRQLIRGARVSFIGRAGELSLIASLLLRERLGDVFPRNLWKGLIQEPVKPQVGEGPSMELPSSISRVIARVQTEPFSHSIIGTALAAFCGVLSTYQQAERYVVKYKGRSVRHVHQHVHQHLPGLRNRFSKGKSFPLCHLLSSSSVKCSMVNYGQLHISETSSLITTPLIVLPFSPWLSEEALSALPAMPLTEMTFNPL
jgi:hypothetical protein